MAGSAAVLPAAFDPRAREEWTAKTFCEPAGEQGAHGETGHAGGEDGGERIDGVAHDQAQRAEPHDA